LQAISPRRSMPQLADPDHCGFDHIARPEPLLRIAPGADARRSARGDDVTGLQVMAWLMSVITSSTLNSIWRVFDRRFSMRLTVSHKSNTCGSGNSSAVTMQGPMGA